MNRLMIISMLCACAGQSGPVPSAETETDELAPAPCDYPQVFGTPQHTGRACPEVHGMQVVKAITQDPDADAENSFSGFLQIHESPPLTSGDWLIVPTKSGFVDGFDRTPERYHVQAWHWSPSVSAPDAMLTQAWSADTRWQPVDAVIGSFGSYTNGYVQLFAPAIAGGSVYVPGASGTVLRLSLKTGAVQATIDPLAGTPFDGDSRTTVNSAVSTDDNGNVYYTVVSWPATNSRSAAPRGSWLVHVRADNSTRLVPWSQIAAPSVGVPAATDLCEYQFGTAGTPAATGPASKPPQFGCGPQRPAMNAPIAVRPDGRLVVLSYANNAQGAAFLVVIDAVTLQPIAAGDTRGHLLHGCGVRLGPDYQGFAGETCDTITAGGTTNFGFDPDFNSPVRFRGEDIMDNAPWVAPNGDMGIGSYDGGFSFGGDFDARGASVLFHSDGTFAAKNEEFAWEVTPSVLSKLPGSFTYLQDRQLYSDLALTIGQYTSGMALQRTSTVPINPDAVAIDFLDAHIPFGPGGDRYGVNGDGHLYKFGPAGDLVDRVQLSNADGTVRSMETLAGYFARDRKGRLYASYAGVLYVIDSSGLAGTVPSGIEAPTGRRAAALQAKLRATRQESPDPPAAAAPTPAPKSTTCVSDPLTGGGIVPQCPPPTSAQQAYTARYIVDTYGVTVNQIDVSCYSMYGGSESVCTFTFMFGATNVVVSCDFIGNEVNCIGDPR